MHRIRPHRLAALLTLATALAALGPATPAGAATSQDCPATKGTIAKRSLGRVWHRGTTLYGCTTVYGHRPRAKRLGLWTASTRVAFDGVNVAWTVRRTVAYRRVDRIWAANIDSGKRWLKGARLVPPADGHPAREARAQAVLQRDQGVAWVTQDGDVVLTLRSPQDDPEPTGSAASVKPFKAFLLLGSWPGAAKQLAASATLDELPGEGDECGAVNPYELTVRPEPSQPPLGVRWSGYWESTNCS